MAHGLQSGLRDGGLSRGGLHAGLGNGSIFNIASLDLNFAKYKNVGSLVTFTRASSGTFVGSDGLLQSAANSAPRFDHNPTTGESLGLLVEEQRTNSIRNNTGVGAVAGVVGSGGVVPTNWTVPDAGMTATVGLATENGVSCVDITWNGTAIANNSRIFFDTSLPAASDGQTWAASSYLKLQAGAYSNAIQLRITGPGTTFDEVGVSASINSSLRRFNVTRTLGGGFSSVQFAFRIGLVIGDSYNFTLRIGLPQLEQGAFATSAILTSTAAATRSADVASISGSNYSSWAGIAEGSLFTEWIKNGSSNFQASATLSDGTNNNVILLGHGSGAPTNNARFDINTGGVNQVSLTLVTGSVVGTRYRNTGAYKVNDFAAAVDGGTPVTDTSGTIPTTSQLVIGANGASNGGFFNGTIRRLCYWPTRLGNQVLQSITQ